MPGLVALEDVVEDAGAAGFGKELRVKADERACGHEVLLAHPPGPVVDHVLETAFTQRQKLSDDSEIVLRDIDGQPFDRLAELSVHQLRDDLRLADGQLKSFAAHRLNQDRQLELASPLHLPGVRPVRRTHPDGDIAHHFRIQAVPDQTRGQLRSIVSRHWRGVDPDRRRKAGLVDVRDRKWAGVIRVC